MIPRAHFQISLVMVSYYGYEIDVISSRWSSHSVLSEKACFFQLFSGMKVNFVYKMTQNIYLCVIIHIWYLQNIINSHCFYLISNS